MTSPGIPLNFYPRPPRGGRPHRRLPVWLVLCHFYPRPPRGGRLFPQTCCKLIDYFYPRPPRGGRRDAARLGRGKIKISIHALREEGDASPSARMTLREISIHALREEGDTGMELRAVAVHKFLSTPSARRATQKRFRFAKIFSKFLSTPSARRATASSGALRVMLLISIHALREEGDVTAF